MIHPTAVVSDKAAIADDVVVGPYAVIGDDVEIASGTRIDSHVVVNGPTKIGKDNHIYQFASIGDDPQDKKYAGEPTRLIVGDRNTIREFCTISRGTTQDKGETIIGDDNWIMAYVHIAHDCVVGDKTIMANNTTLAGHVHIGDWVICGGFSGAHQFCKIGAHAFLTDQIRNIKNAYRLTFRKGKKLADAIREIADLSREQPELNLFLESLRSSERGLIR
jgi:UDP-N-acetylglucosamine acyltransferase